jgi:hypothetical protein
MSDYRNPEAYETLSAAMFTVPARDGTLAEVNLYGDDSSLIIVRTPAGRLESMHSTSRFCPGVLSWT